jgi:DNA replication protein DnaC
MRFSFGVLINFKSVLTLEFGKWINIFYDKEMTAAIIDRLVHHSHLLMFDGDSYRVKNSLISK